MHAYHDSRISCGCLQATPSPDSIKNIGARVYQVNEDEVKSYAAIPALTIRMYKGALPFPPAVLEQLLGEILHLLHTNNDSIAIDTSGVISTCQQFGLWFGLR